MQQGQENMNTTVRKTKRAAPSPRETPAEKFERRAESVMNKVLKQIQVLGNLGARAYEPQPTQIAIMRRAIDREIDRAFARITGRNLGVGFRFKGDIDDPTKH